MVAISDFRNEILSDVPECPIPKVDEALVEAMRTFCEDTYCLEKTLAFNITDSTISEAIFPMIIPFAFGESDEEKDPLVGAVYLSLIDSLAGLDPIKPTYFKLDGLEKELAWFDLDNDFSSDLINNTAFLKGRKLYCFPSTYTVKIFPVTATEKTKEIIMALAMKPSVGSTTVNERFYREYRKAIEALALHLLQKIPSRPWTNFDASLLNYSIYSQVLGLARRDRSQAGIASWNKTAQGVYF